MSSKAENCWDGEGDIDIIDIVPPPPIPPLSLPFPFPLSPPMLLLSDSISMGLENANAWIAGAWSGAGNSMGVEKEARGGEVTEGVWVWVWV